MHSEQILSESLRNFYYKLKFKPASQNGKPVNVQISIPIMFKLKE